MLFCVSVTGLNLGRIQYREPVSDPKATRARLTGLQPETDYRVFLYARTQRGQGEPIFLDATTSSATSELCCVRVCVCVCVCVCVLRAPRSARPHELVPSAQ